MKKFILKWGKGSVLGIQAVYKTMTIEEECIDDVNPLVILPYEIKRRVYYVRKIHTSEAKRNYDYGSYIEFIEVEEIKLNKLSQVDLTFFLFVNFFFGESITKTSLLYGLFKKLGIIYLVSKQTPLVNIPNIVQASLRQVATAATL